MKGSSGDPFGGPVRRLAAHYLTSSLLGLTFPMWCRLLAENRFAIHPMYLPRALAITGSSLINSLLGSLHNFYGLFTISSRCNFDWIIFQVDFDDLEVLPDIINCQQCQLGENRDTHNESKSNAKR